MSCERRRRRDQKLDAHPRYRNAAIGSTIRSAEIQPFVVRVSDDEPKLAIEIEVLHRSTVQVRSALRATRAAPRGCLQPPTGEECRSAGGQRERVAAFA